MNLPETVKNRARFMIRCAWVTMGIPFDVPMVNEKREGIIDVEALFMATFLFMEQDRIVTDLPAWIIRFKDIINHQKLKTMFHKYLQKQLVLYVAENFLINLPIKIPFQKKDYYTLNKNLSVEC